jgi:hypothetical protein
VNLENQILSCYALLSVLPRQEARDLILVLVVFSETEILARYWIIKKNFPLSICVFTLKNVVFSWQYCTKIQTKMAFPFLQKMQIFAKFYFSIQSSNFLVLHFVLDRFFSDYFFCCFVIFICKSQLFIVLRKLSFLYFRRI